MPNNQKDIPEAAASVSYTLTSKDGFPLIFTMRDTSATDLLKKLDKLEKMLLKMNYKGSSKGNGHTKPSYNKSSAGGSTGSPNDPITEKQLKMIRYQYKEKKINTIGIGMLLKRRFRKERESELTKKEASEWIQYLIEDYQKPETPSTEELSDKELDDIALGDFTFDEDL